MWSLLNHGHDLALLFVVNIPMRRFFLPVLISVSASSPLFAAKDTMPKKVDKALAGALKSGTATQKVIITVQPGARTAVRKALEANGRRIKAEHGALNVLVAELPTAEVLALVKNKNVKALSLDGPMTASALLGPVVTASAAVTSGSAVTATVVN